MCSIRTYKLLSKQVDEQNLVSIILDYTGALPTNKELKDIKKLNEYPCDFTNRMSAKKFIYLEELLNKFYTDIKIKKLIHHFRNDSAYKIRSRSKIYNDLIVRVFKNNEDFSKAVDICGFDSDVKGSAKKLILKDKGAEIYILAYDEIKVYSTGENRFLR